MKKVNFGVLSFSIGAGAVPLSNLIEILLNLSKELVVVTGDVGYDLFKNDKRLKTYEIKHNAKNNLFRRAFEYFYTQIKISYKILKIKDVDEWIFFVGGDTLVLPMITIKLIMRKKVFLAFAGSSIKTLESADDNFSKFAKVLSKINCKLSDKIIIYSERLVKEWELENYKEKIVILREHLINFDNFKIITEFSKRENIIGYIGRLSEEKGVEEFLKSIPELIRINSDLQFLICGDGSLKDEICEYIKENNLNTNVKLIPWISHEEVPVYLNQLKLLVSPSHTEGLPNIILEAMACGTPVLTTPVGAIPDFVKDNDNGFIITDNSSNCIERNVIRAIESPNINKIIENAFLLIEKEFTIKNVLKKWEKITEL